MKYSTSFLARVLTVAATCFTLSLGFSTSFSPKNRAGIGQQPPFVVRDPTSATPATTLYQRQNNVDERDDTGIAKSSSVQPDRRRQAVRAVFGVLQNAASAFYLTASIVASAGLLLNLCGYGYMISSNGGIRIDTLDKMKNERQFRAEFDRIGKSTEHQPPSSLPK